MSFRHAAPPSTVWHQRVFGSAVAFGQEFNGIVCSAADLEAANPGADPVMARYSRRLLEAEHGADTSMSDRVRRLEVLLLPRGHCRVEVLAQHLGIDRRTIAKHLAAQGTSFSLLVDAMRQELLSAYVNEGARSLSDVAVLLGFSEPSAFSRWHRHRFGTTARVRRKALRLPAPRSGA